MRHKIKTFLLDMFIKIMITHPGLMESGLFLKIMQIFPEMISSRYDAFVVKEDGCYENIIRAGLLSIRNKPQSILDLCTGTGVAAFLANRVFPETEIVAIDQSAGMLKIAQAKADQLGLALIKFKSGDARRLPEPDHSFDLIITANAPVYLSEITRVLKPGGQIMLAFFFGGTSFVNLKESISGTLGQHSLRLLELNNVGQGAYLISEKV